MREAIKQARRAYRADEVPVGAIIVHRKSRKIIIKASNMMERKKNPLLHAEIVAIYQICRSIKSKNLADYDMYVSLEPCAMCACAIAHARIGRLFYGASDYKQGSVEHGIRFFTTNACFHRPEIYSGFSATDSRNLLRRFFLKIR
jgi:cytosine deaminase